MLTEWFVVVAAKDAWWVDNEGTQFGPFSSRREAEREAQVIARRFGNKERRQQVFAPDDDGKQRMIWEAVV